LHQPASRTIAAGLRSNVEVAGLLDDEVLLRFIDGHDLKQTHAPLVAAVASRAAHGPVQGNTSLAQVFWHASGSQARGWQCLWGFAQRAQTPGQPLRGDEHDT
jgi:hypothetical protein